MNADLYSKLVDVSEEYLGPAAERFVSRQIVAHLSKQPCDILKEDLPKLAEWIKLSMATLTRDKFIIDTFTHKVMDLSK